MQSLKGCWPLAVMAYCLPLLACVSEAGGTKPASAQTGKEAPDASLRLDLANRTLVYPVESGITEVADGKFIQIDIGELVNPRRIRIIFEVRYRPATGADIFLGTFSPYPPDNPGTYIVSTRNSVRAGGDILLSIVPLDEVRPEHELQVVVRDISLRK